MRDVEDAGEVDRDDVFPVLDDGVGRAQHAVAADDAGIVDEDRDLADLVGDLLRHRDAVLASGDIERKALGLAAGVADFLRGFRRGFLVHVEQHDPRALAGISVRDRAPDAGACAGDDGDMIFEKGHAAFPLLLILAEDSKRCGGHKVAGTVLCAHQSLEARTVGTTQARLCPPCTPTAPRCAAALLEGAAAPALVDPPKCLESHPAEQISGREIAHIGGLVRVMQFTGTKFFCARFATIAASGNRSWRS